MTRAITRFFLVAMFFLARASRLAPAKPREPRLPDGTHQRSQHRTARRRSERRPVLTRTATAFNEPIGMEDQLRCPAVPRCPKVNGLGFAFAVTSYSKNGLAIVEGINDLAELAAIFEATNGPPGRTYLVGASEGGIITALALERRPDLYSGGFAACGPIGNFRRQINYLGDFRVVFDYFYPGILPGEADLIPTELIEGWKTVYVPRVRAAISADPDKARQLLRVTKAPVGLDPITVEETVLGVLWYNVFATNDARQKLGGQPFDNRLRWYSGSDNDLRLNLLVDRFDADTAALLEIEQSYQTSGALSKPVVTLHTLGDPIIPYCTSPTGARSGWPVRTLHDNIPILEYGHCNFTAGEVRSVSAC